jgi:hypothetical protein
MTLLPNPINGVLILDAENGPAFSERVGINQKEIISLPKFHPISTSFNAQLPPGIPPERKVVPHVGIERKENYTTALKLRWKKELNRPRQPCTPKDRSEGGRQNVSMVG